MKISENRIKRLAREEINKIHDEKIETNDYILNCAINGLKSKKTRKAISETWQLTLKDYERSIAHALRNVKARIKNRRKKGIDVYELTLVQAELERRLKNERDKIARRRA